MRDPHPLATIEQMEGYRPRQDGEPLSSVVSLNRLADMHEAMNIEEELRARAKKKP